ncbi:MAG: hypothetical protein VCD50_09240 [Alphaproteobacteria bacterium]|jgi:hypothetical protein
MMFDEPAVWWVLGRSQALRWRRFPPRMEVMMTNKKRTLEKDRLKDRSDISEVIFPIEKLMKFRDANASCVHIEAALVADRGLTDTGS